MANKKILFVLPCFGHGGVERLTLNLCNKFLQDGFECSIALRKREGELLTHLNPRVNVIELAPMNIIEFIPTLSKTIATLVPNAVITAFPDIGLLTWVAIKLSGAKTRLVHGVHDTHVASSITPGLFGWLRKKYFILLTKIIYPLADDLVAVSTGVGGELKNQFRIKDSKIHVIYNPIIPDDFFSSVRHNGLKSSMNEYVHIVALGRLAHQKGFDILIKALAKITTQRKWMLSIYGDGPEYNNLSNLISQLGLGDSIKLHGFISDPFEKLASADLFVMPSRHEGLGNVLVEALACGLPVIASDCPHGPREILVDGKYGKLVPSENIDLLAEAISNFFESSDNKYNLGVERASQFTFEASYASWKKLICSR